MPLLQHSRSRSAAFERLELLEVQMALAFLIEQSPLLMKYIIWDLLLNAGSGA